MFRSVRWQWILIAALLILALAIAGASAALWSHDQGHDVVIATPTHVFDRIPPNTPVPVPAFSMVDALRLVQTEAGSRPFPTGAHWVRCVEATFKPQNRTWVVACSYSVDREIGSEVIESRSYLLDDKTGVVR